jgi:hypothetical protein
MMEAARTSETFVNFYQTTWCYNPEDSHLNTHRRENLKLCLVYWGGGRYIASQYCACNLSLAFSAPL